ncbi:MAG: FKBP-type peptidyl-prolyl cis-trans isomerase, partial [Planctomycetia bacterium]|nr:FKBP-type peptidyl-prolyl cis-trans isomerase [Planctomycetia bacterium]
KFDSSVDRGEPNTFSLISGPTGLIKGWVEGLGLMKVGGKRFFVIPPELAYGAGGRSPTIPGNSVLVFQIELLGIEGK